MVVWMVARAIDQGVQPQFYHGYPQRSAAYHSQPSRETVGRSLTNPTLDELTELILETPDLVELTLEGDALTAEHLKLLPVCPQLQSLVLADAPFDDESIKPILNIQSLAEVDLSGTFVTDETISLLNNLPELSVVKIAYTDVTLERIQSWVDARPGLQVWSEKYEEPNGLLGSIRWSDGSRARTYSSEYVVYSRELSGETHTHHSFSGRLWRSALFWPTSYWEFGDGEYEMRITLDRITSETTSVLIVNGRPTISSIEFQMPCTKAEAMASAKHDVGQ